MSRRTITIGLVSLGTALAMAAAAPTVSASPADVSAITNSTSTGAAAPSAPMGEHGIEVVAGTDAFPSSGSTVVGSTGFIDSEQVGYFWSTARGDSVAETFAGPGKVKRVILKLDVVQNFLSNGAYVEWIVSVNGTDVGTFRVEQGQTGNFSETFRFPKITGGSYDVMMRVANEVAGGEGSHTFRYDGAGDHSVTLKKR